MERTEPEEPDDRGQVGIGTLIVFIAMVLVAAIAAGVLINTAGFLQTQAEATGTESTQQVADAINVITEVGEVGNESTDNDTVHEVRVGVQPAAGADDINLAELTVQFNSDDNFSNLIVDDANGEQATGDTDPDEVEARAVGVDDHRFGLEVVTAENEDDIVMSDNTDRYELVINTSGEGNNLGPITEGETIQLTITTGVGSQSVAFLQVPDTLSGVADGETISL